MLSSSHCKSIGAIGPQGVASLDPNGLTGRSYVCDYQTLLHTKYIGCGPPSFRRFFNFFGIISLWEHSSNPFIKK